MRARTSYPTGPFPYLVALPSEHGIAANSVFPTPPQAQASISARISLSSAQRKVLAQLKNGARLMFDTQKKRALLYDFKCGLRALGALSVRCLAGLVRHGFLRCTQKEGVRVHYELVG